jgi:hypothetical protein
MSSWHGKENFTFLPPQIMKLPLFHILTIIWIHFVDLLSLMDYYIRGRASQAADYVHPTFQENYVKTFNLDALCDGKDKL